MNFPLPSDYFSDGDRVFVKSRGPVQFPRESLVDILNELDERIETKGYYVDPNRLDIGYASIKAAFEAADAAELDGSEIVIVVADGTYSDSIDFGNDHPIIIQGVGYQTAKITGDLTFGSSAAKLDRNFDRIYLDQNTLNIEDGCDLTITNSYLKQTAFLLDPTAGTVGWKLCVTTSSWDQARVVESSSAEGTRRFCIENTGIFFKPSGGNSAFSLYNTDLNLKNLYSMTGGFGIWTDSGAPVFDFNDDNAEFQWDNVAAMYFGEDALFGGAGSINLQVRGVYLAQVFGDQALNFGTVDTPEIGNFVVNADKAPVSPPFGTIWEDKTTNRTAIKIRTGGSYPIWRDVNKPKYLADITITDGNGAYENVADAFAAAHAEEPDGGEIEIVVADGTYPDNVDFGTDHPIIIKSVNYRGAIITGNLTFGNYSVITRHLIKNCDLDSGIVLIKDGAYIFFDNCRTDDTDFQLDPTAGTVGYIVKLQRCDVSTPTITETASASGTRQFVIDNGTVAFSSLTATPISIYKLNLKFLNVAQEKLEWGVHTNALINCNDEAAKIWFSNFIVMNLHFTSTPTAWFSNAAAATVYFDNATFRGQTTGKTMAFGTIGTTNNVPVVVSDIEPEQIPVGTIWHDAGLNESLVWTGTYWNCGGGIGRKIILVDIGSAAADHDVGWDVPTGFPVIKAAIKLLKDLTGAGGAVKVGFGTKVAGDPDKYALVDSLFGESGDQNVNPVWNDGGGDDLGITGCDASGNALGTLAGSGDKDAEVRVWFILPTAF